nr:hypothetical protein [Homoserinibacter sp. GY 40078]
MSVSVVGAHADEGDGSGRLGSESCVEVGRSVMGDLQRIHRTDGCRGAHPRLLLCAQIPEQQHSQARLADGPRLQQQHHARGVSGLHSPRRWPKDAPIPLAESAACVAPSVYHPRAAREQILPHPLVGLVGCRADQHRADATGDRISAAHVIEVAMGENQQIDPPDREVVEARRERRGIRPRVNERDAITGAQEDGVSLTDIAHRHLPAGRPGRELDDPHPRHGTSVAHHGSERDDRRHAPPPTAAGSENCREANRRGGSDRDDTRHTLDPRHPRTGPGGGGLGDGGDPRRRQPCDGHQPVRDIRSEWRQETGDQADHGGDRRCGTREKVRHHSPEGQGRAEQHEHRLTRELSRERHGDDERERHRHPPRQCRRERTGEQQQTTRSECGQRESEGSREPRIDDEQQDDRQTERGNPAARAPGCDGQQHDRRHHRSPQHTRLGGDKHHEPDERRQREADPQPAGGTAGRSDGEHGADHDGAVGSGDGGEVRERARHHRLIEGSVDARRVTDCETGQQSAS